MSSEQQAATEQVQEPQEEPKKESAKPTRISVRGVVKPDLRGTSELIINYQVGNLAITTTARHHTVNSKDVQEKIKGLIVYRDGTGKRVRYTDTPFRRGYFVADEDTGAPVLVEVPEERLKEFEDLARAGSFKEPFPLGVVMAQDGKLYGYEEADESTVHRLLRQEDGTEAPLEDFEKTKQIVISDAELRPSVTYDEWLSEAVKEIFAIGPDVKNLWRICEDMNRRDSVAVVQRWVERKGGSEYHLIVKPVHYANEGRFILLGSRVRKPLELKWLMDVPIVAAEEEAKKAQTPSLLNLAGQKQI